MLGVLFPVNASPRRVDFTTLDDMQALVGARTIQGLSTSRADTLVMVDEDGHAKGLQPNRLGTGMLIDAELFGGPRLGVGRDQLRNTPLVGPILVTGVNMVTGDDVDVSSDVLELLGVEHVIAGEGGGR